MTKNIFQQGYISAIPLKYMGSETLRENKEVTDMKRWLLTCSIDAADIDYEQIIESETEPGFWECKEIAEEHGCEWWSLEVVK